jgi:hypothetical protein
MIDPKLYRARALAYPLARATGTVHTRHIRAVRIGKHVWAVGLVVVDGPDGRPCWRAMASLRDSRTGPDVPIPAAAWSPEERAGTIAVLIAALADCGTPHDHSTSVAKSTCLILSKPLSVAEMQAVGESLARLAETSKGVRIESHT